MEEKIQALKAEHQTHVESMLEAHNTEVKQLLEGGERKVQVKKRLATIETTNFCMVLSVSQVQVTNLIGMVKLMSLLSKMVRIFLM